MENNSNQMEGKSSVEDAIIQGPLTLELLCTYLQVECPDALLSRMNEPLRGISLGVLTTKKGDAFFSAATGERGVENVQKAFSRGAICAFVSPSLYSEMVDLNLPLIRCKRPRQSAVAIASLIGSTRTAKTIAVTGSIGKTSAKEMIRLVASAAFKTHYSASNQNGLPQVIRHVQHLPAGTEVYIQEVGLGKPGSVERAASVLRPDYFVITNIGLNHVGYYDGKQEGILNEKLNVDRLASDSAVGFINWDDPLLRKADYQHRVVGFSMNSADADYHANNIVEKNGKIHFDVLSKDDGSRTPVVLNIIGKHNVYNALCAFAVGEELGVPRDAIVKALARFRATGVRQNYVRLGGRRVFLDCYNASEGAIESAASALETIDPAEGGRRFLVLADIDDKLGTRTEEVHRRVGRSLVNHPGIDSFIFFGSHMEWAAEEASRLGLSVFSTCDRKQMEDYIREQVGIEDLIGFKGGQQMLLPLTLDNLYGTDYFMLDGDMVSKATLDTVERGNMRFRLLEDYGAQLMGYYADRDAADGGLLSAMDKMTRRFVGVRISVPSTVNGMIVRVIGAKAFLKTPVTQVKIGEGVTALSERAFLSCANLRSVNLPSTLRFIGRSAFRMCSSLETISIPAGVETIERGTFSRCEKLRNVVIPSSVQTIGVNVFAKCPNVKVRCKKGSYAYKWCKRNSIAVITS